MTYLEKIKCILKTKFIKISAVSLPAILLISLFMGFIFSAINQPTAAAFSGEIVRLHVIANSDSDYDQQLKLKVRDEILLCAGEEIENAVDISSVRSAIEGRLDVLEQRAKAVVKEQGYDYDVKVLWGDFEFPAKTYANVTFPAGVYKAVRVIIGSGEGKNWWCVMFPPLCFVDETHAQMPNSSLDKLSKNSKDIIKGKNSKYIIKFKLVQMFEDKKKGM